MAAIVESRLEQELEAISPEDLGKIDTFQGEETAVLEGAIRALLSAGLSLRVANRSDIQLNIKDAPGIEVKNRCYKCHLKAIG